MKVVRPLLAGTYATLGVLSNPFKSRRRSVTQYYNRAMYDMMPDFTDEVRNCSNCTATSLLEKPYKAGDPVRSILNVTIEQSAAKPNFCDVHRPRVLEYQHYYMHR